MPATFMKMNSFIGNFQDFCLHFMHIFIVSNTCRKLILKCTSLLLKNSFKFQKFQKVYGFLYNSSGGSTTAAISKTKKILLWLHTHTYNVLLLLLISVILIPFTALLRMALRNTLDFAFLIWIYFLYNISSKWMGK